jgi:hypothetical protein
METFSGSPGPTGSLQEASSTEQIKVERQQTNGLINFLIMASMRNRLAEFIITA